MMGTLGMARLAPSLTIPKMVDLVLPRKSARWSDARSLKDPDEGSNTYPGADGVTV